ncbi:MAG: hypothetical protein HYZ11_18785 [Candidatus Tectomicrobia bacterium]|uniref:Uncharacterized protein n=1 Tax=Tectimicrobiota bacterium TaxID=2528274 RepID=A0A932I1J1_UNCTE|nr:hypothetical protein [Candidatus Tectomicrobia bacterium]
MSWRTEWKAISDRIQGLLNAGRFFLETQRVSSSDDYGVADKQLLPQSRDIFQNLDQFRAKYGPTLPNAAVECLNRFVETYRSNFNKPEKNSQGMIQFRFTALAALSSEFSYKIAESAEIAKRLSERAFLHLQRVIVANSAERERWRAAFEEGELACERLGASHLLLHGIWAFKVNAEGERTDLVFGEPLRDLEEVESSAEALVLIEWKVVRKGSELDGQVARAKEQAERYASGSLGGLELAQYRYIIIVSEKRLLMPTDGHRGGIIYRHVNIAVSPDPPSRK